MPKIQGYHVDLGRRDTLKFLKNCEHRIEGDHIDVLHDGIWKCLGRTDLFDEVRSYYAVSLSEDYFDTRPNVSTRFYHPYFDDEDIWGARFDDENFDIIDSLTDG